LGCQRLSLTSETTVKQKEERLRWLEDAIYPNPPPCNCEWYFFKLLATEHKSEDMIFLSGSSQTVRVLANTLRNYFNWLLKKLFERSRAGVELAKVIGRNTSFFFPKVLIY